jgi:hypothetical protein
MKHPETALPSSTPQNTSCPTDARLINGSAREVWHHSAPRSVRRAFSSGDHPAAWRAWTEHLVKRKRPADPDSLLPADTAPLSWALPEGLGEEKGDRSNLCEAPFGPFRQIGPVPFFPGITKGHLEKDVLAWLGESAGAAADAAYALEALASGRAIARLAAVLSPDVWWALLDHLLAAAADAQRIDPRRDPLLHQLLAGELSLTLAYLLPEITPCRRLKSAARRALSAGLVDLLDGAGLPHAGHLGLLRPLLACWTRCRALGGRLKGGCWTKAAENQYRWLVRQALRLTRHDGSQVFSHAPARSFNKGLFAAALRLGGDEGDHDIAALVLPRAHKAARPRVNEAALPEPANDSEWAAVAVLRPRWSRSTPWLTVRYPHRQFQMELSCGKDVLWSGPWELDVRADGRPATPDADWQQLCWVSDDDVDFLELEMELSGGLRVQRQMLLARQDHVLLLADVILSTGAESLQYQGSLPLCPGVSFRSAGESCEGFLAGSKPRALVLPLALPEWRADRRVGRLVQTAKGLQLRQSAKARRLYAPLFFDLDRGRMTRPTTWRQLTVAESLAVQPDEVAVGYRVAVGKEQWLIYRSLAQKANRTLLGHNLSTELLVARFHRSGEVEPLLEIE